jgi:hypothetical protein
MASTRCPKTAGRLSEGRRQGRRHATGGSLRGWSEPCNKEESSSCARSVQPGAIPAQPPAPVFDLDSAKPFAMTDRCPCITPLRGSTGLDLPSRGRRMTLGERLRLQGLPLAYLQHCQGISKRQLGMMIGNAMSGNVLEKLLSQLLLASGLAPALKVASRCMAPPLSSSFRKSASGVGARNAGHVNGGLPLARSLLTPTM